MLVSLTITLVEGWSLGVYIPLFLVMALLQFLINTFLKKHHNCFIE
jgi:hypothetical protein